MKKPLVVFLVLILAVMVMVMAGGGVVQAGVGKQIPDTATATPFLQLVMCPPIAHYAIL
ncbi:MAG: hypothetical protein KAW13_00265 [Dehalococcoidia bacterium]|nr:hypothetical protein [Dehalococcoidia bacterium]